MVLEEIGERRQLFYLQKAQKLHENVESILPFVQPKIRQCLFWIMKQEHEACTVTGHKLFLRKFWIYLRGDDIPIEVKKLKKVKRSRNNSKTTEELRTDT